MTDAVNGAIYKQDYLAWVKQTVAQLREGKVSSLDLANLIEELEGLTRREKNALKSNLTVLLMHLLKCRFQPKKHTRSWDVTIDEHRERVEDTLADSPSLQPFLIEILEQSYQRARKRAVLETGLPLSTFPDRCPFSVSEILDEEFFG